MRAQIQRLVRKCVFGTEATRSLRQRSRRPNVVASGIEQLEIRRLLTAAPATGAGIGLAADYYSDENLTNLAFTQVDPAINFNWGASAPAGLQGSAGFSVQWSGQIQAQFTESYTFSTKGDGGVRLSINGTSLIDDWNTHASPVNDSGSIALVAGQTYDIQLEYFENPGGAAVQLLWSSASTPQAVVPASQLYPTGSQVSDTWLNTNIGAQASTGSVTSAGTQITVTGSGTGSAAASDQLQFVYKTLADDGQVTAEITGQTATASTAAAGLMFRDGLSASAAMVDLDAVPGGNLSFSYRQTPGGPVTATQLTIDPGPIWLKLVRDGNSFVGYFSTTGDSGTWNLVGTAGIPLSNVLQVGLTADAGSTTTSNSATFANVAVSQTVPLGGNLNSEVNFTDDFAFVDAMKTAGTFYALNTGGPGLNLNQPAPIDAAGNALSDFGVYVNSVAPQPGTYSLSCVCSTQPTVSLDLTPGTVTNSSYDPATGVFTASVNVASQGAPGSTGQFILTFTNTSGTLKELQLIRPDYNATNPPIFTNDYLALMQQSNPTVLRFMDWGATNDNLTSNWSDRALPTDATQTQTLTATVDYGYGPSVVTEGKGIAWEYMIDLANTLHTDMWINIPSLATSDYITQLATLIKNNLDPDLNVYIEYSNEVWNGQFVQSGMNTLAAKAEVAAGGSNLNYDGTTDPTLLSDRLVAQNLVNISQIFGSVFGAGSIDTRVRPVLAYQLGANALFSDMLNYVQANYGAPSSYFYSLAVAPYFSLGAEDNITNLSTDEVLEGLAAAAEDYATNGVIADSVAEAAEFGLKLDAYEGGPDTFGPNNIAAKQAANLSPQMQAIITDFLDTWYSQGGGLMNYFALGAGTFSSQYGTWPITDNIDDLTEPKELAYDTVGTSPMPTVTSGIGLPAQIDARNYVGATTSGVDPYLRFINANSTYSYLVQAPASGTYYLSVGVGASTPGGALNVLVNGLATGTLAVPNDGLNDNGDTIVDTAQLPMYLQAGENVIELSVPIARAYNIDSLKITTSNQASLGDTLPMLGGMNFYYQQSIAIGGSFNAGFTVNDAEVSPSSLQITISSDNPTLVPNTSANLAVTGSGRSRTLTVVPAAGQSGTANITLTVSDGQLSRSVLFTRLTVGSSSPTNLVAVAVGTSQIDLTWTDNGQNETGYVVEVSTSNNMANANTYTLPAASTSYAVPGLSPNQVYYFLVYSISGSGKSINSNTVAATTQGPPPSAPKSLLALAVSGSQITLSWVEDSAATGFQVDVATDAGFTNTTSHLNAAAGATGIQIPGLAAGTTYFFRARAINSSGMSINSAVASATTLAVPAVPTNLTASAASVSQINLSWVESNATTGFQIDVATNSSFTTLKSSLIAAAGATGLQVTGLATDTTYYFRVRAINSIGTSANSAVANATTLSLPSAPTNLNATAASTSQINLSWAENSTPTGFQIDVSTTAGFQSIKQTLSTAGATSLQVTGLTANTMYYFRVRAVNSVGTSANSTVASAATLLPPSLPSSPANLKAVAASAGQINLSWAENSTTTGFQIDVATSPGFASIRESLTAPAGANSLQVTGLTAGTTFYFRVRAVNSVGVSSNSAMASAATLPLVPPPAVTAPVVTSNPTTQSVSTGSAVIFTAAASGNPTPTVQWQVSLNGGASFMNVPGATLNSLAFTAPASTGIYQIRAVFTNSQGTATTSAATLTITAALAAPLVTVNPVSQSVRAGSPVTFAAAAKSDSAPNIQWQLSTDGGTTFTNIPGATSSKLTFTAPAYATGYQVRAVFTNTAGTTKTTAAVLKVSAALS